MEEETKMPLLVASTHTEKKDRSLSTDDRNAVTALRSDFFSKLPEKVRSGLNPETPFDIDLSKATGLVEGEKEYYEKQLTTLQSFEEVESLDSPHVIVDEDQDRN